MRIRSGRSAAVRAVTAVGVVVLGLVAAIPPSRVSAAVPGVAAPPRASTVTSAGGAGPGRSPVRGGRPTAAAGRGVGGQKQEQVVSGGGRVVALTFDDGPDPRWTPQVLTLLARFGVHATFCVIGRQVVAYPGLVARIAAAGHRLCNHTFDHDERLTARPVTVIEADIQAATTAIRRAAPQAVIGLFRAPGGGFTAGLDALLPGLGLRPLGWSVDPDDWRRPGAAVIVARVLDHVRPGSIILLHDGGGERGQTVAALRQLLPALAGRGYRFVPP